MTKTNTKSRKQIIIGSVIIIVSALCIFAYWLYVTYYPSTDNAYVQANIINISPQASGYIKSVNIQNNQYVKKGDLLLEIDPINYDIPLNKSKQDYLLAQQQVLNAKKQINNAEANISKANSNYVFATGMAERYANLYAKKAGSLQDKQKYKNESNQAKSALDQAKSALDQAKINLGINKTQVDIAKIGIDNASINKSYTKLYAPASGYIGNLNLKSGQLIAQGQKLFVLIDDDNWWVNVNYEETQISRIKTGQPASVSLDLYDHNYKGKVESISFASGSTYSLLPPQNASGNWVKVAQRFTVKVKIKNDSKYPLRVGASANVSVTTTD
ncbi:MAG: membrane fusion protein (multidrug efflux system) [Francisellaceae bacterium]|jgi:membrane fusion protein (multidrug efflux system)